MKPLPLIALLVILHLPAAPVCAAAEAPVSVWHVSAELGAISTTGNTAGTSVTGKVDARQEIERWSNQYIASGFYKEDVRRQRDGSSVEVRTAQRYALSSKFAYRLDDGDKAFVLATHVEDRFGPFVEYSTLGVGRSTHLEASPDKTLDLELGPGYFVGERPDGESESGVTVRGAAALRWQVSAVAQLSHTISIERGTSNVHSITETALSTKINDTMRMKAAFIARNDTNVPEPKKNTDTQTSLTLMYAF